MKQTYGLGVLGSIFAVPAAVVDKHIKLCSGVSLKVLLMLLRSPEEPPDVAEMARRLGMSDGDIIDALGYWVEAGILTRAAVDSAATKTPATTRAAAETSPDAPGTGSHKAIGRPRLPRREMLDMIEKNNTLKGLVDEIQMALGKPLTSTDMDAIVALYTYYGLSAHYIMTVVQFCDQIGKLSVRYIEKVAAAWQDEGVTSDNIDDHVAGQLLYRSKESKVRRDLGIYDRALAPTEQKYLKSWCDNLALEPELIRAAYDIAVTQTGKLSFAYMNKILTSWHQKGITDQNAAMAEHDAGKPVFVPGKKPDKNKQPSDNKQSFDAGRLERLIEAKLQEDGRDK